MTEIPSTMRAVRLLEPGGPERLVYEEVPTPAPTEGEARVRVHAAALTREELDWPVDRLPAIPSYELSGVVAGLGPGVDGLVVGAEVWALTPFDRDGVAADYAVMPGALLAPKPTKLDHLHAATIPLPGLSAWQGLFDHGGLAEGQRVLIHGASGGVGRLAVELAVHKGAQVMTTFEEVDEPVDLVFDTAGGERLAKSAEALRPGGKLVTVTEEPPGEGTYFVVEPKRDQLVELGTLVEQGVLTAAVDQAFALEDARAAFERVATRGKRGKVVLEVAAAD